MLWTYSTKLGHLRTGQNGTSGDASIPIGDLASWNTPSVRVFVWCNGDRGRQTASSSPHSVSLSICSPALPQFTTSGMRRLEQLLKLSMCVCVLIHMSTRRNYSSKWEPLHAECQHWFGDWIPSQLGEEVPPMEARETLCLSFLSISWGCDGSWCLCQLSKQVHLSCFINIGQTTSSPGNNRNHTDKETLSIWLCVKVSKSKISDNFTFYDKVISGCKISCGATP